MSLAESEHDIGPSELPYPIAPSAETEAKEAAEFINGDGETAAPASAAVGEGGEEAPASAPVTAPAGVGPSPPPLDEESRNLIINYLPSHIDENALRELFIPHGEIEHVKVVKDKITGQSAGYGFVKYVSAADAAKAIEALNGYEIGAKRIKVSVAKPPTKKEPEKPVNLYISGLPLDWEKEQLHEFVSAFGQVHDARVLHDPITRKPRGVGFVRMDTHELALQVIEGLNGQTAGNSKLKLVVKFSDQQGNQPRKAQLPGYGPMTGRGTARFNPMAPTGAVGGYGGYPAASPYGAAPSPYGMAPVMGAGGYGMPGQMGAPSPYGGYPGQPAAGYGAAPAYGAYGAASQPGMVSVPGLAQPVPAAAGYGAGAGAAYGAAAPYGAAAAQPRAPSTPSLVPPATGAGGGKGQLPGYCLFVLHLPTTATDQTLYQLFSNYGTVLSTKIMRDLTTGESKGFGFVNMETVEQAQLAIQSLTGYQLGNKRLQVSFKTDGRKQ